MKGKIVVLFLLSVFFLNIDNALAQIDNSDFKLEIKSNNLKVCGGINNASTVVVITAKKVTLSNFLITLDLSDGVEYIAGSMNLIGTPGYTVIETNISNLNTPIFSVSNGGNWAIGDQVTLTFERAASCDAVVYLNSGGLFKDAQTINYKDSGADKSASNSDPSYNAYDLLAGSLSIQNAPIQDAFKGALITRNIHVFQGGNGCIPSFIHTATVGIAIANYRISYNGTILTPVVSGNDYIYTIDMSIAPFAGVLGNGDDCFDNGEELLLVESFKVTACTDDTNVLHNAYWGCTVGEVCQSAAEQEAKLNMQEKFPKLKLFNTNNITKTELCSVTNYKVEIKNESTDIGEEAFNVNINIGQGLWNSPATTNTNNPLFAFDYTNNHSIANFKLNGIAIATSTRPSDVFPARGSGNTFFIPEDYFMTDPDGIGVGLEDLDGDGYYDDLLPGGITELSFDYSHNPETGLVCDNGYKKYLGGEYLNVDVNYESYCNLEAPESIMLNSAYITKNAATTVFSGALADNSDFLVTITPNFNIGGTDKPFCNGEDPYTGSDVTWKIKMMLPAGVTLQPAAIPNLVGGSFSVSGNEVTYTLNRYEKVAYEFPLHMNVGLDCSNGVPTGTLPISWEATYSCASCWTQKVYCVTETFTPQCEIVVELPNILSPILDVRRITPGWTDKTMTSKVILDPNVHELQNFLATDTMRIEASAVIVDTAFTNLNFALTYDVDAGGDEDDILYLNGEITINDISSPIPITGALVGSPTVTTLGIRKYEVVFDLSSYVSLISPTYEYGEGKESDTVTIVLYYKFKKDNYNKGSLHYLKNFTGRYYAYNPVGNLKEGNGIAIGQAAYLQTRVQGPIYSDFVLDDCKTKDINLPFYFVSNTVDLHPGEYRPPIRWKDMVITLPGGVTFMGVASITGTPWKTGDGTIIANQVGNLLTLTPSGTYFDRDQAYSAWNAYKIRIKADCAAPISDVITYNVNYDDFTYTNQLEIKSFNNSNPFVFNPPAFTLSTMQETVNGTNTEVFWDVDICNNSNDVIDYNWLDIPTNPNVSIINAFLIDGGGNEVATNTVSSGGNYSVEAGSIAGGSCKKIRIYASYSSCNSSTIAVNQGWNCDAYPTSYPAEAACYINSLDLTVVPQESQIQLEIKNQPTGLLSYCTPYQIALDVISAQLADVKNAKVIFNIPGVVSATTINSISIEYPKGSGDTQIVPLSIAGNTVTIDLLTHTQIGANAGLLGTENGSNLNERIAHIIVDLRFECEFINAPFTFEVTGSSPCGLPAIGNGINIATLPFVIFGTVKSYDAFSTITLPANGMKDCGVTETIDIVTTIIGGVTKAADSAQIILPAGVVYAGAFTCIGANCPTIPAIQTVGDHQELFLKYPSGVSNNEEIHFEFNITAIDSICNNAAEVKIINSEFSEETPCGGTTCPGKKITTGTSLESMVIEKPNFALSSMPACNFLTNLSGDGEYDLTFNIENTGLDASAGYVINYYCADNSGNPILPALYTDNTAGIVNGATITHNATFTVGTLCNPSNGIVIKIVPSTINCMCSAESHLLAIQESYIDTATETICDGDSILLGGVYQFAAGVFNDTLLTTAGCDSVIVTTLTVNPAFNIPVNETICDGDSILLGGAYQFAAGTFNDTLLTTAGCDSVIITTLTVNPAFNIPVDETICDGDSILLGGAYQFAAGIFNDTLMTDQGCDSIIVTTLTVNPVFNILVDETICDGDSVLLGGAYQFATGVFNDTLLTTAGCDSIIVTTLTVNPVFNIPVDETICQGDSIFLGGAFQVVAGDYNDTLMTVQGCDSVVITTLTIDAILESNTTASICLGDSIFLENAFQYTAGIYRDTISSSAGCDSVIVTDLAVDAILESNTTASICLGDSIFLENAFQYTAGIYRDTISSSAGCDSVIVTDLAVDAILESNTTASICLGDSIFLENTFQYTAGIYRDTVSSVAGCDSVIVTDLAVDAILESNTTASICLGDSIFLENTFQYTAGLYRDTISSSAGCDSVVVTALTVIDLMVTNLTQSICAGDSIYLQGGYQFLSGTYYDTLSASSGCNAVSVTMLVVEDMPIVNVSVSICQGDSILLGGVYRMEKGIYYDTANVTFGCGSLIVTNLTITSLDTFVLLSGNKLIAEANATTYQWVNCVTNEVLVDETEKVLRPTVSGNYAVMISEEGCTTISACYAFEFDDSCPIEFYPNPVQDYLTIDLCREYADIHVRVMDLFGRRIYEKKFTHLSLLKIDLSDYANSSYFIDVRVDNKIVWHQILKDN